MREYFKKIVTADIDNEDSYNIIQKYRDQPQYGESVLLFESPETLKTSLQFVNFADETDEETEFSWYFGYNDGHPCVFITFTNIKESLKNEYNIICLETNTKSHKSQNSSLNVYIPTNTPNDLPLNMDNENLTWFYIKSLELNKTYIIYISHNSHWHWGQWSAAKYHNKYRDIPEDWEINISIRPSIRCGYTPYTNYKALSSYQQVSYLLKDEIKL